MSLAEINPVAVRCVSDSRGLSHRLCSPGRVPLLSSPNSSPPQCFLDTDQQPERREPLLTRGVDRGRWMGQRPAQGRILIKESFIH